MSAVVATPKPGTIRYRLRSTGSSSDRLGPCEVCAPCNEDDWIFQMPRKWFRKMMRYRRSQTRKVLGRARTEEIRRTYR